MASETFRGIYNDSAWKCEHRLKKRCFAVVPKVVNGAVSSKVCFVSFRSRPPEVASRETFHVKKSIDEMNQLRIRKINKLIFWNCNTKPTSASLLHLRWLWSPHVFITPNQVLHCYLRFFVPIRKKIAGTIPGIQNKRCYNDSNHFFYSENREVRILLTLQNRRRFKVSYNNKLI